MKKSKVMMAFMVSASLLLGACGSNEPKEAEVQTPVAEQVINTTHAYICPMNCENSASMDPGQCKVCGMDLVKNPNYAGATDTTATTADSTAAAQQVQEGEKEENQNHENHEGHNH